MEFKRSKVFPGTQKPNIDGVYERDYSELVSPQWELCRYSNGVWYACECTVEHASKSTTKSIYQRFPWRGLATNDGK